jgi:hypothetical protein
MVTMRAPHVDSRLRPALVSPPSVRMGSASVLANGWDRADMMRSAIEARRVGRSEAIDIAICCQIHNPAVRSCLENNRDAVYKWLRSQLDDIVQHIDWAFKNEGTPCDECRKHQACCVTCSPPGKGSLPRKSIAVQAAAEAKAAQCRAAIGLLVQTQCHNDEAAKLILGNPERVCSILQAR